MGGEHRDLLDSPGTRPTAAQSCTPSEQTAEWLAVEFMSMAPVYTAAEVDETPRRRRTGRRCNCDRKDAEGSQRGRKRALVGQFIAPSHAPVARRARGGWVTRRGAS